MVNINSSKQVKRKQWGGQSFYYQIHYANAIMMTGAQLLTTHKDELLILSHSLHTVKQERTEFRLRATLYYSTVQY